MKSTILCWLALFFSFSILSQTKEDYTNTLKFISTAYNEKNASAIHQKFSSELKQILTQEAFVKRIDSLHNESGNMSSYEFLMEEDQVKNFLVEFEGSSKLLLIYLSPEGQISKFDITEY